MTDTAAATSGDGSKGPRGSIAMAVVGAVLIACGAWVVATAFLLAAGGGGPRDFQRHWVNCQYVRRGLDPYDLSVRILRRGQDSGDPAFEAWGMRDMRMVPGWRDVEGVLPQLGPPETTYPPSWILLLTCTAGQWPEAWTAAGWATVNVVLLAFICICLVREAVPADFRRAYPAALVALGLFLLWPPTASVVHSNQLTFLSMAFALCGLRALDRSSWQAGLWLGLSLFKPSFGLLFLIYPIIRGRFLVVVLAGILHVAATLVLAAILGSTGPLLVQQWLEVASHFLQGMYSIQEILNRLGPERGPVGTLLRLGLLGAIFGWCWWNRASSKERQIDFLCFANLLWVYHGDYDFVLLLLPLAHCCRRLFADAPMESHAKLAAWLELGAYVVVGLGLLLPVYRGDDFGFRQLRWMCRLSLLGLFAWNAIRLRTDRLALSRPLTAEARRLATLSVAE